ncbi:hypothetical protein ACHHYP_01292 [Achlya hypogyna]|uniref:Uncharacterized protein n=1 Tax=Achlya hypogyna TaxID=1202772 RepID=A0A1V9Z954_ACHHY|nr:hypothetical protein ACHHYP_01292 [Achlya hypogyna]
MPRPKPPEYVPLFARAKLWTWETDAAKTPQKAPKRPQTARPTREASSKPTSRPHTARRCRENGMTLKAPRGTSLGITSTEVPSQPMRSASVVPVPEPLQCKRLPAHRRPVTPTDRMLLSTPVADFEPSPHFDSTPDPSSAVDSVVVTRVAVAETSMTFNLPTPTLPSPAPPSPDTPSTVATPAPSFDTPQAVKAPTTQRTMASTQDSTWSFYAICRAGEASATARSNASERAYLRRCSEVHTVPKPLARSGELDLSDQCHGYASASALASRLAHDSQVAALCLRNNSLRSDAIKDLVTVLPTTAIASLDISENAVGPVGVQCLAVALLSGVSKLVHLNLAGNHLMDRHVLPLVAKLDETCLESLDLSYNELGNGAIVPLGRALVRTRLLRQLNLRWNNVHGLGLDSLADGLKKNVGLADLDLAWNPLGSSGEASRIQALANFSLMLRRNMELHHLVLEANNFTVEDLKILDSGLRHNYTLVLHLQSDVAVMDARQHLRFDHFFKDVASGETRDSVTSETNCWLCNGWREHSFNWRPPSAASVETAQLCLEIDQFHGDSMSKVDADQSFVRHRMVPPRPVEYYCTRPGTAVASSRDVATVAADAPVCRWAYPRWNPIEHEPSAFVSSWGLHQSLFTARQSDFPSCAMLDGDAVLHRAVEIDWDRSRIHRVVKRARQQADLQALCKEHARDLYCIYRYYSALNVPRSFAETVTEGFGLRQPCFVRLCEDCEIYDNTYCRPTDVDRIFHEVNGHLAELGFIAARALHSPKVLARFEFIEVLIRLARLKFGRLGTTRIGLDIVDAFRALLQHHVLPFAQRVDGNGFRQKVLYRKETEDVLECYLPTLHAIFDAYGSPRTVPHGAKHTKTKRFMDFSQTMTFLRDAGLVGKATKDAVRHAQLLYLSCKLAVADELSTVCTSWLTFYDFLELVVRIAEWRHPRDVHGLPQTLGEVFGQLRNANPLLGPRLRGIVRYFEAAPNVGGETLPDMLARIWAARAEERR